MDWEEIEKMILEGERQVNEVLCQLQTGVDTFTHPRFTQEGFLHPCNDQEHRYQFTFFDGYLQPVGDFRTETLEQMAKKIVEYQFSPCKECRFLN